MTGRVMRQSRTGLIWLTNQTEDEGGLNELLLDKSVTGGEVLPLAAAEAVLIVARMTRQPADWAFSARIWTEAFDARSTGLGPCLRGNPRAWHTDHHHRPHLNSPRDRVPGGPKGLQAWIHRQR